MAKKFPCPTCGDQFDSPQAVGAHRARKHGFRRKKAAPKLPAATKAAVKQHMTTIHWTELVDDNGSGRRLFVDENDDWWVAKKLDI